MRVHFIVFTHDHFSLSVRVLFREGPHGLETATAANHWRGALHLYTRHQRWIPIGQTMCRCVRDGPTGSRPSTEVASTSPGGWVGGGVGVGATCGWGIGFVVSPQSEHEAER